MNIHGQVFVWVSVFNSFWFILRDGIASSYSNLCWTCWRTFKLLHGHWTFTFSSTIYEGSSFLTSSLKLVISLYFYNLLESFSCPRNHICWREYSFLHWIFWTCFWKSVEHRYMVLWVLNSKFHFIGVYVYLMSVTHYFDCSVSKSESVSHLTLFLFLLFFWKCFSYSGSPMIPHEL